MQMKSVVQFLSLALLVTSVRVDAQQQKKTNALGLTQRQTLMGAGVGLIAAFAGWRYLRTKSRPADFDVHASLDATGKSGAAPSEGDSKRSGEKTQIAQEQEQNFVNLLDALRTHAGDPEVRRSVGGTIRDTLRGVAMRQERALEDAEREFQKTKEYERMTEQHFGARRKTLKTLREMLQESAPAARLHDLRPHRESALPLSSATPVASVSSATPAPVADTNKNK